MAADFSPLAPQEAQTLAANAGGTFPVPWQKLSLRIAALQIPKAKCTKMLPHAVSKSLGLTPAGFLGAYSPARRAFTAHPAENTGDVQVLRGLYVSENRKAVQAKERQMPRLRRR